MAKIMILGVPMDLGAGRRGVDMGPSALRLAGLAKNLADLGHTVTDLGNVSSPILEASSSFSNANEQLHFVDEIASTCTEVYAKLKVLNSDVFPIILGGDHSMSMGSVSGVASKGHTGVLWVDAHTDVNTPNTSPSGNIHGMPLSHLLGQGDSRLLNIWSGGQAIYAEDIVFIGLRSVDEGEKAFLKQHGITAYTMTDIDKEGMATITQKAINQLAKLERVHVSFDADALDPSIAPGVGTPVPGGLSYREAHLLMEMLSEANIVSSLDLVEVNPILDSQNKTARIMIEMTTSLLGKAIL